MDPQDRLDAEAGFRDVRIRGSRLLLRALRPDEIEPEWQAMVTADPMAIAELPEETSFKSRLGRPGHLEDGWLDLAIDLEGVSIGRIQTFVPQAGRSVREPSRWGSACGPRPAARIRTRSARAADGLAIRACSGSGCRGSDRSRQRGDANGLPAKRLDARRIIDRVRP